ncbi:MAG: response regulator [Deltaproteobacteria bacterium]|nr:response regulator [Deltaproteobacteria bacterium]
MSALSLRGVRILIVEDNFVVADALKFLIEGYEGEVVAMAPNLERAFAALARHPVDVSVLDINLNETSVVPLADALHSEGRRFVFLSGYGDLDLLPAHLRDRPRLDKPVEPERLVRALSDLLAAPA